MSYSDQNVVVVLSHPVQYLSPLFRALHKRVSLKVLYFYEQTAEGQAEAGFSEPFEWDIPLLEGYDYEFVENVARFPSLRSFLGTNCPGMSSRLKRLAPDAVIVYGWNTRAAVQAIVAAKRLGFRVLVRTDSQIGTHRSILRRILKELPYRMTMRFFEYLVAGERSRQYLRYFGVRDECIHDLPHAVETDRFRCSEGSAATVRSTFLIPDDEFVFLYVGKFISIKRPIELLKAFIELSERHHGVRLVMVGSGPLADEINRLAEHCEGVILPGFVNQSKLPPIYGMANVLVLPGDETWGLVANEAIAAGTPVIVSRDAGSYPELIEKGGGGWGCEDTAGGLVSVMEAALQSRISSEKLQALANSYSVAAAAKALNQVLSTDRETS